MLQNFCQRKKWIVLEIADKNVSKIMAMPSNLVPVCSFKTIILCSVHSIIFVNQEPRISRTIKQKSQVIKRVTDKHYTVFQSLYQTILTSSYSSFHINQTILTYSELISNIIHTFTELLQSNSKHFFESFNGHLNRPKIVKKKIPK